ncbi:MAG: ArsB/NhaD family transporter [Rubrobacteraceae bacterium]
MEALLAGLVLMATLALILVRPRGVSEAWWAVGGASLTLALGLVSVGQAEEIVIETHGALMLLVGMMALSAVAEKAGFFEWVASLAARAGGGSVFTLYAFVFAVGTLVTATLSLDATAIVLTPIVYGMVARLRLSPIPFMFACVYTANTASMFLPVSNLTGLLAYNAFDLGFVRFGMVMLLPSMLAVVVNFALFSWLFRKDLRGSYQREALRFVPENRAFLLTMTGALVGVLAALFAGPLVGASIGVVALAAGTTLVVVAWWMGWMRPGEVVGSVSWGVVALVVGLFVVVRGVENVGLTALAERAFASGAPGDGFWRILGLASGSAVGSNVINNVPMIVLALGALHPLVSDGTLDPAAIYAVVVGASIGPNLTTVGSLATLIWLGIARDKGLDITAGEYLKVGIISTPVILLAAAFGLWISIRLFGS